MKICLISPPTVSEFNDRSITEGEALRLIAEHAPIGILSLGAVLAANGFQPQIVDLNRPYYDFVAEGKQQQTGVDFCSFAANFLDSVSADVFGFSTICGSYPLTLRLARAVQASHPDSYVILGGPQASVVDVATLQTYQFVDLIVRGEAEQSLPRVLEALSGSGADFRLIEGVTYRQGGRVLRNCNAPVIEDLDSLPMPAFELYPQIKECSYVPIEGGRGCPFACSFCSTNDFFRRRFRMKSAPVLVGQMRLIKQSYGIDSFDLIHDMFTVDRRKVLSFCEEVINSGEEMFWSCSARTDCLDDELLDQMAAAGCNGIFFGIDSGSDRVQTLIQKRLDLSEAASRIKRTNRHGIKHTVSLITGFPEETREDLRGTIQFLGDTLHYEHSEIQLHLLAPLAETPITTQYREQLEYDDIFSDISFQGWEQNPEEREMIIAHRDIFPNFYAVPTAWLERNYLRELREFILHGILKLRWLIVMLQRDSQDLLLVFDEWQTWSGRERLRNGVVDTTRGYYASDNFPQDFVRFVRSHYVEHLATQPHLVNTICEVENAKLSLGEDHTGLPRRPARRTVFVSAEAVPVLPSYAQLLVVSADYNKLMKCLKRRERLELVPPGQVPLLVFADRQEAKVIQLNRVTHELMRLCNGGRTIAEIANDFTPSELSGIPPLKASIYGLAAMARKGLIEMKPSCG